MTWTHVSCFPTALTRRAATTDDAAGEREQHLALPDLRPHALDLVGDEVLHVPVGLGMARLEQPFPQPRLVRHRRKVLALRRRMVDREDGEAEVVERRIDVHVHTVHAAILAAEEHDALHVRQRPELRGRDVVGVDLRVNAHGPDLTGHAGILLTAQVQNQNHILLHGFLL